MLHRLADWVGHHPWRVVLIWAVVALPAGMLGGDAVTRATTDDQVHFLPSSSDSARAAALGREAFGEVEGVTTVTGLVERQDRRPLTGADRAAVARVSRDLPRWHPDLAHLDADAKPALGWTADQKRTRVVKAVPGPVSGDGRLQLVAVGVYGNTTDPAVQSAFGQLRTHAQHELARAGLRAGFTGGAASELDTAKANKTRGMIEQGLLLGAIVLLNLMFFRGILAALIPLVAVTFVGGLAVGVIGGAALLFDVKLDPGTPSLIPAVLTGIGVDYFLFLVFRFRERLRTGEPRKEAASAASARVSEVIVSAAFAVIAAFATLGLAEFKQFQVLGPAIAVSVAAMLLAGLTLMPALLAISGRGLFWPSKAWLAPREGGFAARLGERIAARPARYALGSIAALGVLAAFALAAKPSYDLDASPAKTAAARVEDRVSSAFSKGASDPQNVIVSARRPLDRAAVDRMAAGLRRVPGVASVEAPQLSRDGRVAQVDVVLRASATSRAAMDTARGSLRSAARTLAPPGSTAHVGGTAAVFADVGDSVNRDLRLIFPVAAVLIALILVLVLRSVLAPAYLLAAVALGFAATLGLVVLAVQVIGGSDGVIFTMPLVLFLFVVALGTDYNILMAARLREELRTGQPVRAAVARAVRHAAPAIAAAGLILATSFGTLALDPAPQTREMGLAMSAGILLSAFVVSTLLVPAVTALVGPRAFGIRPRPRGGARGRRRGAARSEQARQGSRPRAGA